MQGPVTLAGIPMLRGALMAVGADVRAFFALSVGFTPADAKIIQNDLPTEPVDLPWSRVFGGIASGDAMDTGRTPPRRGALEGSRGPSRPEASPERRR